MSDLLDFLIGGAGGVAEDRAEQRARGRARTVLRWWNRLVMVVGFSLVLLVAYLLIRDTLR